MFHKIASPDLNANAPSIFHDARGCILIKFSIQVGDVHVSDVRLDCFLLQRRGLGPLLCDVMGLNESNHFSGLTSAFRAAYEKSNLKVGLFSAFDQYTSLKLG